MNQSTNQNVQPVEVVDLAKTQVLNLNEVEETVVYENKTNKKPAIMLAIAGLFSIIMGFVYPMIMNSLNSDNTVSGQVINSSSSCFLDKTDDTTGLVTRTIMSLNFGNAELMSYSKSLTVTLSPTADVTISTTNYQTLYSTYKVLETTQIPGYTISSLDRGNGFTSSLDVDLKELDSSLITASYNTSEFTSVNFKYKESMDDAKAKAKKAGYACD